MSNWQRKTLKEVVKTWIRGSTPRRNNPDYYCEKGGVPFARVGDLEGGEIQETELYLTWEGAEQVKESVPEQAVLLSVSGTIGKIAMAGREMKINQAIQAMVFDEKKVLAKYGYYYLQFFAPWLEEIANTVTIPNLTRARLEQISILFPCLEEQKYIVTVMEHGESLLKSQEKMGDTIQKVLYQTLQDKVQGLLLKKQTIPLGEFFTEQIQLEQNQAEQEIQERKEGDLLFQKRKTEGEHFCRLFREESENHALTGETWRVRIRMEKLKPEFLLLWVYYGKDCLGLDFYKGTNTMDTSVLVQLPIPKVSMEVQQKLAKLVEISERIQRKGLNRKGRLEQLYKSLLAFSFTARLTKDFRKLYGLEEPEEAFFAQYYYAKFQKEDGTVFKREVDWAGGFSGKEKAILKDLSLLQRKILELFMQAEQPMPIHRVFGILGEEMPELYKEYTIQDAREAVKILMGLGFLEKAVPEKIFLGDAWVTDSKERPVTIQKYKAMARN